MAIFDLRLATTFSGKSPSPIMAILKISEKALKNQTFRKISAIFLAIFEKKCDFLWGKLMKTPSDFGDWSVNFGILSLLCVDKYSSFLTLNIVLNYNVQYLDFCLLKGFLGPF